MIKFFFNFKIPTFTDYVNLVTNFPFRDARHMFTNWLLLFRRLFFAMPLIIVQFWSECFSFFFNMIFHENKNKVIANKLCLVVGPCNTTFGKQLVREINKKGGKIAIFDKDTPENRTFVKSVKDNGGKVEFYDCDPADKSSFKDILEREDFNTFSKGKISYLFYGNLLAEIPQNVEIMTLYSNVVEQVYAHMSEQREGNEGGHIVLLTKVDDMTSFRQQMFIEGLADSILARLRAPRKAEEPTVHLTIASIYKKILNKSTDKEYIGIYGKVSVHEAVAKILEAVRDNQTYVYMPFYTRYFWKLAGIIPLSISATICDLVHRPF